MRTAAPFTAARLPAPEPGPQPSVLWTLASGGFALDDAPFLGQALTQWADPTRPFQTRSLFTQSLQTQTLEPGSQPRPQSSQGPGVMSTKLPEETNVTSHHRAWW